MQIQFFDAITCFRLTGSRAERAMQHGEYIRSLAPADKATLAFGPLSSKNQHLIKRALKNAPLASRVLVKIYEAFVFSKSRKIPKSYRDRILPFAQASGLGDRAIWFSLFQPDFLMLLAKIGGPRLQNRFFEGNLGCSSVIIESQGDLHFLRNLDYPAAGFWEKHPAIFYHEPSEPGHLPYAQVSSVGVDIAGLTGINAAGIAFSLHAHFTKNVQVSGVPIFFLGEDILEHARTLDDAIRIAREFKTIGSWAINLSSFAEKKSVCLELSKEKLFIRPAENGVLGSANHFSSPEFAKDALHFTGAALEDSEARKLAVEEVAKTVIPDFTWKKALHALGSHVEPMTQELRIMGNVPSVITTIQSIGFDWKNGGSIYVSSRNETPTGLGPYLRFPLTFPKENYVPEKIEPEVSLSSSFLTALHLYHEAYVSWQVKCEDSRVALSFLKQAVDALPTDSHLRIQLGVFEIMNHQFENAIRSFQASRHTKLTSNTFQVSLYFEACAQDLLGQRDAALQIYHTLLGHPRIDSKLHEKTVRRLTRPMKEKEIKSIAPDLQFVEPIEYK